MKSKTKRTPHSHDRKRCIFIWNNFVCVIYAFRTLYLSKSSVLKPSFIFESLKMCDGFIIPSKIWNFWDKSGKRYVILIPWKWQNVAKRRWGRFIFLFLFFIYLFIFFGKQDLNEWNNIPCPSTGRLNITKYIKPRKRLRLRRMHDWGCLEGSDQILARRRIMDIEFIRTLKNSGCDPNPAFCFWRIMSPVCTAWHHSTHSEQAIFPVKGNISRRTIWCYFSHFGSRSWTSITHILTRFSLCVSTGYSQTNWNCQRADVNWIQCLTI